MKKRISLLLVAILLFGQNSFVLAENSWPKKAEHVFHYLNLINSNGELLRPFNLSLRKPFNWSLVPNWLHVLLGTAAVFGLSTYKDFGGQAFDFAKKRVEKWQNNGLEEVECGPVTLGKWSGTETIGDWGDNLLEKYPKAQWESKVPLALGVLALYHLSTRTAGWKYSMAKNYYATQKVLDVQRETAEAVKSNLGTSTWSDTKSTLDDYEKRIIKAKQYLNDVLWKAGLSETINNVEKLTVDGEKKLPEGFKSFAQKVKGAGERISNAKNSVEPKQDAEEDRSLKRIIKWSMLASAVSNTGRFVISSVKAAGDPKFLKGLATIGALGAATWLYLKKL